jgi:predicted RNase H-like nuclease (RuvC/YqgF family)
VAERLIEIARHPNGDHPDSLDPERHLQREIEEGLAKVGYQGEDVTAIARRLVHPNETNKDDSSSRTELTMRLKAQARLGEELPGKHARRIPLTSAELAQMQRVQQAPVGTWFEFITNPQGDRVRRRLAWLSTSTGDVLFVNQRGQKNAEYTLDSLARLLAKGQVAIVEEDKTSVIDRAWEIVLNALRSFAVPGAEGESP